MPKSLFGLFFFSDFLSTERLYIQIEQIMLILANNHQPPFNVDISFRCSLKKNQIVFYTDADMYIYLSIFF